MSRKIQLRLDLSAALPPLYADPVQLQQVIMNLLTNAVEAIGEEDGGIVLRTELVAGSGDAGVRLVVTDTGPGMDEATLGRIFEPFFSTKFTGRGLGLAAVQGIVRGHSGTLDVESSPGQGSTFSILLPAGARSVPVPVRVEPSPLTKGSTRTILVVDDEENVRNFVSRALVRAGYRVLSAAGGSEALDLFRSSGADVDAVLLDLTMPDMDGREVLRALRQLDPAVRVVISSGFSEHDQAARGEAGSELFLQKPYMLAELLQRIDEVLQPAPSESSPPSSPAA